MPIISLYLPLPCTESVFQGEDSVSFCKSLRFIIIDRNFLGPVVSDGFGLGYGYFEQSLGVFCSSYRDYRDGKEFLVALVESLDKLGNILESKENEI